jgi:hypothetical protein
VAFGRYTGYTPAQCRAVYPGQGRAFRNPESVLMDKEREMRASIQDIAAVEAALGMDKPKPKVGKEYRMYGRVYKK